MHELAEVRPLAPNSYVPDIVERFGRRWKMEYVGMTSVFAVLFLFFFNDLIMWQQALAATAATYLLFLGLKKKTRDHICTSFLMFAVAAVALDGIAVGRWAIPFMLFGACLWALEGYMEKRKERINTLPVILAAWALAAPSWIGGLLFICSYLTHVRPREPHLRRRLAILVSIGALATAGIFLARSGLPNLSSARRIPLAGIDVALLLSLGLPTLVCLLAYWRSLAIPHRINAVIFGLLAPWDLRALAVFGIAASVVLAATVLRNSADSPRFEAALKHAEWYFFWVVLVVAVAGAVIYIK